MLVLTVNSNPLTGCRLANFLSEGHEVDLRLAVHAMLATKSCFGIRHKIKCQKS